MRVRILILYSWFIRTMTFFLPEIPLFQRLRGALYAIGMKKCGRRFRVSFNVVINHLETLEVADNVYLACGVVITGAGRLVIGSDVLVGPNVVVATSKHVFNGTNFLSGYEHGQVVIEVGSWIGANASLLMGTHIGASSVVGAGAIVNASFKETKVLIAGNPARVVKSL